MMKLKIHSVIAITGLALAGLTGCQWMPEVGSVRLSESSVTLKVGGAITLTATVEPSAAEYEGITWMSSDPSVASVSNGTIVARKIGATQVTASAEGVSSSPCQITVTSTPVRNISLNKSSVSILEGESVSLKVTVSPSDATNSSVTWSSGNSKVATVSSSGTITAVEEGETTITAKSNDNGISATCKVTVTAEYVDIPDANFRQYILENFDLNKNGKLSLTEAAKVTSIKINTDDVESLAGIEYMTNLQEVDARPTPGSQSSGVRDGIPYYEWSNYGKLNNLDISQNVALKKLNCCQNLLDRLVLSNNQSLEELRCDGNNITSLDLTNNSCLKVLASRSNTLRTLTLPNNTALTYLDCAYNQLTSLDVSRNIALTTLWCTSNQLTSLDVSKNTALTSLYCYSNQLTSLDVSRNTALTSLYCDSNQLTSLDVSKNTALTSLSCDSNQLTSLDVSKNTALTSLYCYSNQLTSLDVSRNTALTTLWCASNQLTSLDVSRNTALTYLTCYSNQLTSLDVSKNTKLTYLDCSPMSSLKTLYVYSGQSLDKVTVNRNSSYIPEGTSILIK